MRLNYPTKWVYKFDSATEPSGFTKFDSATQPSGFTNLTSPYMTEYYNFTSWVLTRPFHQITNMTLRDQYQKNLKRYHISEPP